MTTFLLCFFMPLLGGCCVLLGFKLLDLWVGLLERLHGVPAKALAKQCVLRILEWIPGVASYFC